MNIQIKHMKTCIGREGYGFNASLYVDGKKIAFIMDDANGGPEDGDDKEEDIK